MYVLWSSISTTFSPLTVSFQYTKYTYAQLDASASLLAHHLKDTGLVPPRAKGDATSKMTVGLLGSSTIDYVVTELALYRMGYSQAKNPEKTTWEPILNWKDEFFLPVTVIHSSGSTGFPKPIIATNKAAIGNCANNFGLCSLTTLPLYHGHGHSNLFRAIHSAKTLYLFPTGSIPLTSANVIKLLGQAPDVEGLYGVPLALKLLAETSEGLAVLKKLKLVMFGGSACPDELGDFLVAQGVRLLGHYGLTEMGQLMTSFRDFENDKLWNWVRAKGPYVKSNVNDFMRFEDRGDGKYELYVLDGWHTKVMSNQPDGSYATKDLLIKHPTLPDAYKFVGRIDDTLVMVNGEKTNPVPIELTLRSSPYIADAIIFGTARTQIGGLILPTEAAKDFSAVEFTNAIAPTVALANSDAPSHSQLAAEALVFLPYGTVIPRADKGSILRPKIYKEFEKTIDEVYRRLEGELDGGKKTKLEGEEEARRFVKKLIGETIERPIDNLEDDTDLFEWGLDSLQSTRIRNAIQRGADLNGKKLSSNAVFENPSISKIAKLIVAFTSGDESELGRQNVKDIMLNLVEKYRHFEIPLKTNGTNGHSNGVHSSRVVVMTGVTGSLGAYLLDEMIADPSVETVYCLCRAKSDTEAAARVNASMKTRRLLSRYSPGDGRVVALASESAAERLGLQPDVYDEIVSRATLVIHNAWAVNFNLGISSFETHIRGAVNLMNLALASPRKADFYFASSNSAVASWPGPEPVPEIVTNDPSVAQGLGYAQSKWVTEKLCQIASQTTPLRAGVLRIGQMVGDSSNGIWNETEAISLIFKCANTVGVLPDLEENVSWLPVDYAAKTIVELVNLPPSSLPVGEPPVWHVLHPKLVPWASVLESLRRTGLTFKVLPRRKWLDALQESSTDEVLNPSRKLLQFYQNKYGPEVLPVRYPLVTAQTQAGSESLRNAPIADDALVAKWVTAWRQTGFLH
ncbi:putative aminoadipate reductase [Serpula lacrymans var. lacrymans S7.9]|uniref:Putative aminoadipate reductase n=1 Tax=Serpula lacrymans var. lacrymans (strain S7.9) TaxID=578457 RepID=F8NUL2_SERL9|nr:putative aminoadipate reductase [Serpula lacrymans var. lacrymans S7.9]EGO25232.1 putative aminoadipate reductase [Serpula lacrymans var. lacrymans S7.9]